MIRLLHFADAHIDMINYGRHDPQSGLPVRVTDFLKSLDTIVDAAIHEKVDLVIFAGDAYRDRNPAPTFQREWGRRIMRLSRQGIPTLLLVGNHDVSPALNRAHALDPFETLETPHIRVIDRPTFLKAGELEGLPVQVIALPWISRSGFLASIGLPAGSQDGGAGAAQVYDEMVKRLLELVETWLEKIDPDLPVILMAHGSVEGAIYGGERTVMLGSDLVMPASLVRDPRLDYVALGHIHRSQNLNENKHNPRGYDHPPVIYPGSIERVDFGEAGDRKYFVLASVERGQATLEWRELSGIRPFVDRYLQLRGPEDITKQLLESLPSQAELEGTIARLVVDYPREWDDLIDETALHRHAAACLEFHLVKRPEMNTRIRIPENQSIGSLSPYQLLDLYWKANHTQPEEAAILSQLAKGIIEQPDKEEV
jgi:exonuclease SbcD